MERGGIVRAPEQGIERRVEETEPVPRELVRQCGDPGPHRGRGARSPGGDLVPVLHDEHARTRDRGHVGDATVRLAGRTRSGLPEGLGVRREASARSALVVASGGPVHIARPAGLDRVIAGTGAGDDRSPDPGDPWVGSGIVGGQALRAVGRAAVPARREDPDALRRGRHQDRMEERVRPVRRGVAGRDTRRVVEDAHVRLPPREREHVHGLMGHEPVHRGVQAGPRVRGERHVDGRRRGHGAGPLQIERVLGPPIVRRRVQILGGGHRVEVPHRPHGDAERPAELREVRRKGGLGLGAVIGIDHPDLDAAPVRAVREQEALVVLRPHLAGREEARERARRPARGELDGLQRPDRRERSGLVPETHHAGPRDPGREVGRRRVTEEHLPVVRVQRERGAEGRAHRLRVAGHGEEEPVGAGVHREAVGLEICDRGRVLGGGGTEVRCDIRGGEELMILWRARGVLQRQRRREGRRVGRGEQDRDLQGGRRRERTQRFDPGARLERRRHLDRAGRGGRERDR